MSTAQNLRQSRSLNEEEATMPRWIILRVEYTRGSYSYSEIEPPEFGQQRGIEAPDAGTAFKIGVIDNPRHKWNGEYAVFPMEGSVRIGVHVNLEATEENGDPIPVTSS